MTMMADTMMADEDPVTDTHTLDQRSVVTQAGRRYRLIRAVPKGPPPAPGYPVIYLLDGNAAATALSQAALCAVPHLLVICVGYETDQLFALRERWLDYTPPCGDSDRDPSDRDPKVRRPAEQVPEPSPYQPISYQTGGAPLFLQNLCGDLRQAAEHGLPVDGGRRGLWGHSLGGVFTLYAVFRAPMAFRSYYPVSPSLWWGDGVMDHLEQTAVCPPVPAPRVFIMLGNREVRSGQTPPLRSRPAPETMALIERLKAKGSLEVSSRVLDGMGHRQALFASLPMALGHAAGAVDAFGI